jgi:hypothetical protein
MMEFKRRRNHASVEEMRRHVECLMAPLSAPDCPLIVHTSKRRARAALEVWEIWVPEVKSTLSYARNLHELGHLLGRHRGSRYLMTRERDAWRWAKTHALRWTDAMERERLISLAWYAGEIKNRRMRRNEDSGAMVITAKERKAI